MKIANTLVIAAAGAVLLGAGTLANAQTATPSSQGLSSVEKNLAKDTDNDNKGLRTAQQRIERNEKRHALRKAALADRKADRAERPTRPERAGR